MNAYNFSYRLSDKGLREEVKAGGYHAHGRTLTIDHTHPAFPTLVDKYGVALLNRAIDIHGEQDSPIYPDLILEAIERSEAIAAKKLEEKCSASLKRYDEEVLRVLTHGASHLVNDNGHRASLSDPTSSVYVYKMDGSEERRYPMQDPRLASLIAEAQAIVDKINGEYDLAREKELAAKQDWIAAYGSERLKLCVKEGIECDAIYRDERLAKDRPGWCWYGNAFGRTEEPRNPPEDAFKILAEARVLEPEAKLAYYTVDEAVDFDGEGGHDAWRGYVAEVQFLSRTIIYGLPTQYHG